jgi:hypothetical protein
VLPYAGIAAFGGPGSEPGADLTLGCPADLRGSCAATVSLSVGTTTIGTATTRLRPGASREVRLRLTPAGRALLSRPSPNTIDARVRVVTRLRTAARRVVTGRVTLAVEG